MEIIQLMYKHNLSWVTLLGNKIHLKDKWKYPEEPALLVYPYSLHFVKCYSFFCDNSDRQECKWKGRNQKTRQHTWTDHHLSKNSRAYFGRDQKCLIPNPRLRAPEQRKSKKPKSSIAQCWSLSKLSVKFHFYGNGIKGRKSLHLVQEFLIWMQSKNVKSHS